MTGISFHSWWPILMRVWSLNRSLFFPGKGMCPFLCPLDVFYRWVARGFPSHRLWSVVFCFLLLVWPALLRCWLMCSCALVIYRPPFWESRDEEVALLRDVDQRDFGALFTEMWHNSFLQREDFVFLLLSAGIAVSSEEASSRP